MRGLPHLYPISSRGTRKPTDGKHLFCGPRSPDIRRKLQKFERFITQLIEVANKVYMNREVTAKREAEKKGQPPCCCSEGKGQQKDKEGPAAERGEAQSLLSKGSMCLLQGERTLENKEVDTAPSLTMALTPPAETPPLRYTKKENK